MNLPHKHPLIFLMLLGLLFRVVLAVSLTHIYDVASWGIVVENLRAGEGIYDVDGYYYTPVWGYVLEAFRWCIEYVPGLDVLTVRPDISYTDFPYCDSRAPLLAFAVAVKVPLILADLGVAWLLYVLTKDIAHDEKKAVEAFGAWMLLVPAMMISCVSGMFDNISVLFLLLSFWSLRKGKYPLAGAMLSLGCMTKLYPGLAAVAMLIYIAAKEKEKAKARTGCAWFVLSFFAVMILVLLPQILQGDMDEVFHFLTSRLTGGSSSSGLELKMLAIIAAAAAVSVALPLYMHLNGSDPDRTVLASYAFAVSASLLVYFQQQYQIEVLPILVLALCAYGMRFRWFLMALSLCVAVRMMDELPTMLLPLAESTDLISVDSLSGIADFLRDDALGRFYTGAVIPLCSIVIHYSLFLMGLAMLVSSVPVLRVVSKKALTIMTDRFRLFKIMKRV